MTTGCTDENEGTDAMPVGIASTDQLGAAPKRCTDRVKCQGDDTRYDTVDSGVLRATRCARTSGGGRAMLTR